uniref:Putative secreted protein n=1 Tax=Anopheles triannulatus TaxID=58253 RepID=A0A2M4B395_9DIPT
METVTTTIVVVARRRSVFLSLYLSLASLSHSFSTCSGTGRYADPSVSSMIVATTMEGDVRSAQYTVEESPWSSMRLLLPSGRQ